LFKRREEKREREEKEKEKFLTSLSPFFFSLLFLFQLLIEKRILSFVGFCFQPQLLKGFVCLFLKLICFVRVWQVQPFQEQKREYLSEKEQKEKRKKKGNKFSLLILSSSSSSLPLPLFF
jgi:hypothetical protein